MNSTTTVSGAQMTIVVAGKTLSTVIASEVGRDLSDICGSFNIEYEDEMRVADALGGTLPNWGAVAEGDSVEISIGSTLVFKGWVDDVELTAEDGRLMAMISGRDVTCDLVDCTPDPAGPGEYRNVSLEQVVTALCTPFGISVTVDAQTGDRFRVVAIEPGETVMATIEKLSRQRGILVVSNGIGGLLLTTAGTARAPEALTFPGNVLRAQSRLSYRGRYSDVWVKGQFRSQVRPSAPVLDATAEPLSAIPTAPAAIKSYKAQEASSIVRYGHAVDGAVRYRPRVFLAATQSGGSTTTQGTVNPPLDSTAEGLSPVLGKAPAAYHASKRRKTRKAAKPRTDATPWTLQDQADWRLRTLRAEATERLYVLPWLRTQSNKLFLANQLVMLTDDYGGFSGDRLIKGVRWSERGDLICTELSLISPDAYDLTGDDSNTNHGLRKAAHVSARS